MGVWCATLSAGRAVHAPLTPILVTGPFDRVGVDVIQFPQSHLGNQYAVVFVDYLTKWPEVYPTPDQSAATIANLLVREIISRHGVPSELLSDRGRAFLSGLLKEVQLLLGFKKVNTSAYHPQTDGLVERFNRTLTAMLAKTVERGGRDWDQRLPFVLFAYRGISTAEHLRVSFLFLSTLWERPSPSH
jgi:transposase InsO family protein